MLWYEKKSLNSNAIVSNQVKDKFQYVNKGGLSSTNKIVMSWKLKQIRFLRSDKKDII